MKKQMSLADRYRINGEGSTGSPKGNRLYKRGIKMGEISDRYDQKNYEYYYEAQEHDEYYERMGLKYFLKAAKLFKRAAQYGHDLATMNYALYLYAFEHKSNESLEWFFKASELGLAVADYQLAHLYKTGCEGLAANKEKSDFYMSQYKKRIAEDERQRVLANIITENTGGLWRLELFTWFHGASFWWIYDTPNARPSRWRWG